MNLYEILLEIIKSTGPRSFHSLCDEVNNHHLYHSIGKKPLKVSHIKSVVSRKKDLFSVHEDVVYMRDQIELQYLTLTISGYPRPSYKIHVDFIKNNFMFFEWCIDSPPETLQQSEMYIGSVEEFKKELFELEIWKWKRDYQLDYLVLDGTSWSVKLKTKKKTFESEGLQAFPDNWPQFCQAIYKLTGFKFI